MSDQYWLPHAEHVWVPGTTAREDGNKTIFNADSGGEIALPSESVANLDLVQTGQLQGVDDICSLAVVNEAALLHTVRVRYADQKIYTRVSRTLIAVNPFAALPIYSFKVVEEYRHAKDTMENAPHIFAIGKDALDGLKLHNRNQAVLISGESGAGKTESCKLVLSFVVDAVRSSEDGVEDQLMQTNPVLEAFGNAMTVRNNNSSRFGKWLDLRIATSSIEVVGSTLTSYLLETMRVTTQGSDERCFHVFFQLLQARETNEFKHMKLSDPMKYRYLRDGRLKAPNVDDAKNFAELKQALCSLGFKELEHEIWGVVGGILELGNTEFTEANDLCQVVDDMPAASAAQHLAVPQEQLLQCLRFRKLKVGREETISPNSPVQARAVRDGLARLLYGQMFLWLIERINKILSPEGTSSNAHDEKLLGVLDIAGFECFKHNSLEQLFINLSNEHLQQHFNQVVFKTETAEYTKEGVPLPDEISFKDNADCLALLDAKEGILDILDEMLIVPKATDDSYVTKVVNKHGKHERLVTSKIARKGFGVKHFAGDVNYSCEGWIEKNTDNLPSTILELLATSKYSLLQDIAATLSEQAAQADAGSKGKKKVKSVSSGFRTSLRALMSKIEQSEPHYIRCVKPNVEKVPGGFTSPMALEQLRNSGVLAAVQIRQEGYAQRLPHQEFVSRFRCIVEQLDTGKLPKELEAALEKMIAVLPDILQSLGLILQGRPFAKGKTKIFLKMRAAAAMEAGRKAALRSSAIKIQCKFRQYRARQVTQRRRSLITKIKSALVGNGLSVQFGLGSGIRASEKPRKRSIRQTDTPRASCWTSESVLTKVHTPATLQELTSTLQELVVQCGKIGFRNADVSNAQRLVRRMHRELDTLAQVEKHSGSIDPMAMEKALTLAQVYGLPETDGIRVVQRRVNILRKQLPLVKGMKIFLSRYRENLHDHESDVDETIMEITEGVEAAGLDQDGNQEWIAETGGADLFAEVTEIADKRRRQKEEREQAIREAFQRAAKEAAQKEAEKKEAERRVREAVELATQQERERKERVEAERLAREAEERAAKEAAEREAAAKEAERLAREAAERAAQEAAEREAAAKEAERLAREAAEQAAQEAERATKEAAERAAQEQAAREAALKAEQEAKEVAERAAREAARRAAEEAAAREAEARAAAAREAAEREAAERAAAEKEAATKEAAAREAAEREAAENEAREKEAREKEAAETEAREKEAREREAAEQEASAQEDGTPEDDGEPLKLEDKPIKKTVRIMSIPAVKHVRCRQSVITMAPAVLEVLLGALEQACENYDVPALEQLLGQVSDAGLTEDQTLALDISRELLAQLQDPDFVLDATDKEHREAESDAPTMRSFYRLLNLAKHLDLIGGYDDEVFCARAGLQSALAARSREVVRMPGEVEMAQKIFGELKNYAYLKPEDEWQAPTGRARAFTMSDSEMCMLSHSGACIANSLTRVPEGEDPNVYVGGAVQNFRNVMVCMGDRPAPECQKTASRVAVVELATSEEVLRDEVYVQVLKQLINNPSETSEENGWMLLRDLCQQVPPEDELEAFVLAFVVRCKAEFAERKPPSDHWSVQYPTECEEILSTPGAEGSPFVQLWEVLWWAMG